MHALCYCIISHRGVGPRLPGSFAGTVIKRLNVAMFDSYQDQDTRCSGQMFTHFSSPVPMPRISMIQTWFPSTRVLDFNTQPGENELVALPTKSWCYWQLKYYQCYTVVVQHFPPTGIHVACSEFRVDFSIFHFQKMDFRPPKFHFYLEKY